MTTAIDDDAIARATVMMRRARAVVALTGAGISTDSGIPDFRGPQGLWTKDPTAMRYATLDAYISDAAVRRRAWEMRRDHPAWSAEPNDAHLALARLEQQGRLAAIVTQNIDGLHQRAGSTPERVIELHGSLHEVMCLSCGERGPMSAALDRVAAGEEDPECRSCGGILKSATISFGQALDPVVLQRALARVVACDLLLVIGTSLSVYPAAHLPQAALDAGARVVIVNAEPTPLDGRADAVVRGSAGPVLTRMARSFGVAGGGFEPP